MFIMNIMYNLNVNLEIHISYEYTCCIYVFICRYIEMRICFNEFRRINCVCLLSILCARHRVVRARSQ